MKGKGDLPLDRHLVSRRSLGGFEPSFGNAIRARPLLNRRVAGIEKQRELLFVEILDVLRAGGAFNAVGVIKQHAEIADTSDTGLGTDRGLSCLDTRVAEDAFLG